MSETQRDPVVKPPADAHHKSLKRFSVRSLIVALTLLCAWLSWHAEQARQQQAIIRQISNLGGSIRYRDSRPNTLRSRILGRDYLNPVVEVSLSKQTDYSFLAGLRDLRRLALSGREITDISTVVELENLTELGVVNAATTDISPAAQLTNLKILTLHGTLIEDISSLVGLRNLEELAINDTSVRDLTAVAGMSSLRKLYLGRTPVTDIRPLAGVRYLSELQLDWTPVRDLSPLRSAELLSLLSLVGSNVRDVSELSRLVNLRTMSISAAPIENLETLAGVLNLGSLSIDQDQLRSEALAKVVEQLPNCQISQYVAPLPVLPYLWQNVPQQAADRVDRLTPEMDVEQTLETLGLIPEQVLWELRLASRTTLAFKPPDGYLMLCFVGATDDYQRRKFERAELLAQKPRKEEDAR